MTPAASGGPMLRTPFLLGAVASGTVLASAMSASAAPVTVTDLQGKKICWSDGGTPTYGASGDYDERGFGHGTWSLAGGQLKVVATYGEYTGEITKDNGR